MKGKISKQEIADLLNKFMAGETSLDEENILAQYFRTHEVSDEWKEYKEMFAMFDGGMVEVSLNSRPPESLNPRPLQGEREPKRRVFWRYAASAIAASIVLLIAFNYNNKVMPDQQPVVAEVVEQPASEEPETSDYSDESKPSESSDYSESPKSAKPAKIKLESVLAQAEQQPAETGAVKLSTTADSLAYYLTRLENQMGDCRDSICLAHLSELMRADERIKGLVNKIIHKQVETAYQEEYLVDTTTRYIPL